MGLGSGGPAVRNGASRGAAGGSDREPAPEERGALSREAGDPKEGELDAHGSPKLPFPTDHDMPRPAFELADASAWFRMGSAPAPTQPSLPVAPVAAHLAELVTRLVRRVAWGGDGRRGTVRLEIGDGELAGATVVVTSVARTISVELELPPGVCPEAWRERISKRLTARGLDIDQIEVR
jgi:hypothetical protein